MLTSLVDICHYPPGNQYRFDLLNITWPGTAWLDCLGPLEGVPMPRLVMVAEIG